MPCLRSPAIAVMRKRWRAGRPGTTSPSSGLERPRSGRRAGSTPGTAPSVRAPAAARLQAYRAARRAPGRPGAAPRLPVPTRGAACRLPPWASPILPMQLAGPASSAVVGRGGGVPTVRWMSGAGRTLVLKRSFHVAVVAEEGPLSKAAGREPEPWLFWRRPRLEAPSSRTTRSAPSAESTQSEVAHPPSRGGMHSSSLTCSGGGRVPTRSGVVGVGMPWCSCSPCRVPSAVCQYARNRQPARTAASRKSLDRRSRSHQVEPS